MRELPVIFNDEMVRAILDGRKERRKIYAPRGVDPLSREHLARRLMNGIDRINEHGCWEWGLTTSAGYGCMTVGGKPVRAHRLSLAVATGVDERSLSEVLHSCDNPLCINPSHLSNGTHADNVRDAVAKGRARAPSPPRLRGEENPASKLTRDAVLEIKRALAQGRRQRDIAREFGVKQATISDIARGKCWRATFEPMEVGHA